MAPGYACAPRAEWLRCYRNTVLPKGAHLWYKGGDGLWWLGKSVRVRRRMGYTWSDFWTIRGRSSSLFPRRATRPQRGPYEVLGACKFTRPARSLGGVQRNVDDSRGAAVISSLSRRRRAQQFYGFLGSPPWVTSGSFCVLGFEFTPWVAPGLFWVLGSAFSLWVVPGAFCVLRSSSCLLYTSPSPRDRQKSRMPSSA